MIHLPPFDVNWTLLDAGGVQIDSVVAPSPTGAVAGPRLCGAVAVAASAAALWETLCDWAGLSRLVPGIDAFRVLRSMAAAPPITRRRSVVEGRLRLPGVDLRFDLMVHFDDDQRRQAWRLLTDDEVRALRREGLEMAAPSRLLVAFEGTSWVLSRGHRSVFCHAPVVEVSRALPGEDAQGLARRMLEGTLLNVRAAAEGR